MRKSLSILWNCSKNVSRVLAISSGLALVPNISFGALVGQTVTLDQLYPAVDQIVLSLGSAVVGPGIEFLSSIADYDWDVNDATIAFSRFFTCGQPRCSIGYTPSSFNGFRLGFSGATLPEIFGVEVLEVSGFSSYDVGRITFDASNVFIGFGGIEEVFDSGTNFGVKIGLQFAGSTPEPATFALSLCGLAALGWFSRRR